MMDQKEHFILRQKITVVITIIMLLGRIFFNLGEHLISDPSNLNWYLYYHLFGEYMLISIVLWLNRESLTNFNIDNQFIIILIFSGGILSIYYLPGILGVFTGIATFRTLVLYSRGLFKLSTINRNYVQLIAIIVIALLPYLFLYTYGLIVNNFHEPVNISTILYESSLPQIVIEEVIFRGALWVLLVKLNLNPWKIILIQGILFTIAHLDFISAPHLNIVWTLWIGIWLGIIVWHSKSLAPSTLTHFVADFLILIIRN